MDQQFSLKINNINNGLDLSTQYMVQYYNQQVERFYQEQIQQAIKIKQEQQFGQESKIIQSQRACPVPVLKNLKDQLPNINTDKFKTDLSEYFYDAQVMAAATCITDAIIYSNDSSGYEKIKQYITKLRRIERSNDPLNNTSGNYFFEADFNNSAAFVIKVPAQPNDQSLTHEYFIASYALNKLRSKIPNFAYIYASFSCSIPALDQEDQVVAWCTNDNNFSTDYLVYENVMPVITLEQYIRRGCNFQQWLNIYLQTMYSLQLAWQEYDFTHYDLTTENVLVREINQGVVLIPYNTEQGRVEYLEAHGIATIIDYSFSHIKYNESSNSTFNNSSLNDNSNSTLNNTSLNDNSNSTLNNTSLNDNSNSTFNNNNSSPISFGAYNAFYLGVLADYSFPMHDAYKLLMFSMRSAMQYNPAIFNQLSKIFTFFNKTDDPSLAVQEQAQISYFLAPTEESLSLNYFDITSYIRANFITNFITSDHNDLTILGCTDMVCPGQNQFYKSIGMAGDIQAHTVIQFYNLVSTNPLLTEQIENSFDYNAAVDNALQEYDGLIDHINIFNNTNIQRINGLPVRNLFNQNFYQSFRAFVANVLATYESYQHLKLLYEAIIFVAQKYQDQNLIDIMQYNYNIVESEYELRFIPAINYLKRNINYINSMIKQNSNLFANAIKVNSEYTWYINILPTYLTILP